MKEWVTVAESAGTKRAGPVVTVTGKLHVESTFAGPAVVYLQPVKGPPLTVRSVVKARTGRSCAASPPVKLPLQ